MFAKIKKVKTLSSKSTKTGIFGATRKKILAPACAARDQMAAVHRYGPPAQFWSPQHYK